MRATLIRILAALVCGSAALTPTAPASAHPAVCAGNGTFTLDDGLYYPVIGPQVTTFFSTWTMTGTCSLELDKGSLNDWCNHATGSLRLNDGTANHTGRFTWVGPFMTFDGPGITGEIEVSPAPGESCLPGGPGTDSFTFVTAPALAMT